MRTSGIVVDLVALAGVAAIVNGVRLVHPPSAWIVAGIIVVAFALAATWRKP